MSGAPAWSEDRAIAIAEQALQRGAVPGDPLELRLLRLGTNGVFKSGQTIVRVSPSDEDERLVQQQIDLAAWLVENGFSTSAPLVDCPRVVEGHLVTAWSFIVGLPGTAVDRRKFGALLRQFHELTNAYTGELPIWEPLGRLAERLDSVPTDESFSETDRRLLCSWRDDLTAAASEMAWELPPGPLHGDVHTGNLIVTSTPYLVDLDRIATGPREWDLTQQAASVDRFGASPSDLAEFLAGYEWDLLAWPKHHDLVRLRLLFMTSWLLTLPRTAAVKGEIQNRITYWEAPEHAPLWRPV